MASGSRALVLIFLAYGLLGCGWGGEAADLPERTQIAAQSNASRRVDGTPIEHRQRPGGRCLDTEVTLFNCRAGNRSVAICGGTTRDRTRYARYSSGTRDNTDLEYPLDTNSPPIRWARRGFSGGGGIQYMFFNNGNQYIAYSNITAIDHDRLHRPIPGFYAGVFVQRAGVVVSELQCTNAEDAGRGYDDPADYMPEGEYQELP
jgi:hypothetical protein